MTAMLMGRYCCLSGKNPRRKHELERGSVSVKSKGIPVRIVHPGGRQELYESALPAWEIMHRYPGTCVARPGVFNSPEESLLTPEENLMPGHKYLIIPSTTAEKLKRRHRSTRKSKAIDDDASNVKITWDEHDNSDESVCSAKDFYASNGWRSRCSERKNVRPRQPFVPPLPMCRSFKGLNWEPSLTSVQELSP